MGLEWQTPLALLFLPHTLQSLAAYSEGRVLGRQPYPTLHLVAGTMAQGFPNIFQMQNTVLVAPDKEI